jgi:hypothetical protein
MGNVGFYRAIPASFAEGKILKPRKLALRKATTGIRFFPSGAFLTAQARIAANGRDLGGSSTESVHARRQNWMQKDVTNEV